MVLFALAGFIDRGAARQDGEDADRPLDEVAGVEAAVQIGRGIARIAEESTRGGFMANDDLLTQALALPPAERIALAERLFDSLDADESDAVASAWSEEIRRRLQELDAGTARVIPEEEALRQIFALPDATG